jgi:hypothetical protein
MRFKDFLLNEGRAYFGEKVGDILTAVHDLDDGSKLGARQMVKFYEKLVVLIRRILHTSWPETERKHLKTLQKIGVAIMNSIEQKDDLRELLPSIRQELEDLSGKLGMPINSLGSETKEPQQPPPEAPEGQPEAPQGPEGQPEQPAPQQPQQPPQPPQMGQAPKEPPEPGMAPIT